MDFARCLADTVSGFKTLIANNVLCFKEEGDGAIDEVEFFVEALQERHDAVCRPCGTGMYLSSQVGYSKLHMRTFPCRCKLQHLA